MERQSSHANITMSALFLMEVIFPLNVPQIRAFVGGGLAAL